MRRYSKLIGTILGGVTGSGVVAAAAAFGWSVPESVALVIAGVAASLGTLLAPAQPAGWKAPTPL